MRVRRHRARQSDWSARYRPVFGSKNQTEAGLWSNTRQLWSVRFSALSSERALSFRYDFHTCFIFKFAHHVQILYKLYIDSEISLKMYSMLIYSMIQNWKGTLIYSGQSDTLGYMKTQGNGRDWPVGLKCLRLFHWSPFMSKVISARWHPVQTELVKLILKGLRCRLKHSGPLKCRSGVIFIANRSIE